MRLTALTVVVSCGLLALTGVAQATSSTPGGKTYEELARDLESSSSPRRVEAVDGLVGLGTREAWVRVLSLLVDEGIAVADAAQLGLGRLEDPAVIKSLFTTRGLEPGPEQRQARIAEALGRMKGDVGGDDLLRALSNEHATTRRLLLWSIERRARAGRFSAAEAPALARQMALLITNDADSGVRAASLAALAAVAPENARSWIVSSLGKKDSSLRCAALAHAHLLPEPQPFDLARRYAREGPFALRSQALANLGATATRPAVLLLVERLEKEESLGLRWAALRELQRLSGSDVELVAPFWRNWAEKLPEDWRPAEPRAKDRERRAPKVEGPGTGQFLGLQIAAQSVAILIDLSGSMRLPNREGRVRKDVVDVELDRTLRGLAPRTSFNLIPYGTKPDPWSERLRPATKESVEEALAFFAATKATGYGNLWDSIELALADPDVENLLVLTDGHLSAGAHTRVELVRDLLIERLRFRRVTVDVLLVDARPELQAAWRELCAALRGRMLAVELD